jgi:hypothetical protein
MLKKDSVLNKVSFIHKHLTIMINHLVAPLFLYPT